MDLSKLKLDATTQAVDVLLKEIEEKTSSIGKSFCRMSVNDTEHNEYPIIIWNQTKENLLRVVQEKAVVTMDIATSIYNDSMSYECRKIYMPDHEVNIADFASVTKRDIEDMYQKSLLMVDPTTVYGKIVYEIYRIFKKDICFCAAGKSAHHDYIGGLLEHSYDVARTVNAFCDLYPDLNREMITAGALLHDIGKIFEMKTDEIGVTEYTLAGNQIGHTTLGIKLLMKVTCNMGLYNTPEREILEAMIASHHGKKEHGALAAPGFKEAYFLHIADDSNAKNNMFDKEYQKMEHGELSSKRSYLLGDVFVWRP